MRRDCGARVGIAAVEPNPESLGRPPERQASRVGSEVLEHEERRQVRDGRVRVGDQECVQRTTERGRDCVGQGRVCATEGGEHLLRVLRRDARLDGEPPLGDGVLGEPDIGEFLPCGGTR